MLILFDSLPYAVNWEEPIESGVPESVESAFAIKFLLTSSDESSGASDGEETKQIQKQSEKN